MAGRRRDARRGGLAALAGRESSTVQRNLTLLAVGVVLGLVALAVALAWRQYDDQKRRAVHDLRSRAVLAATVFDTYFAGELATLSSIAASSSVVDEDEAAMRAYFLRLQRAPTARFNGGLAWIDAKGLSRVSSSRPGPSSVSLADRSYFRAVMTTGKPFISEGLTTRLTGRRVIVMAVPTHDASGRPSGVLAGSLLLRPTRTSQRALDLGYAGIVLIDRAGQQLTDARFAPPPNGSLLPRLRSGEGALDGVRGIDGRSGRVVAFANSKAPGWTTVIDQPQSSVFAAARHALLLTLASIVAAALTVLGLIAWLALRAARRNRQARAEVERWDELTRSLGDATRERDVSELVAGALHGTFPDSAVAVALEDEHGELALTAERRIEADARPTWLEAARLALERGETLTWTTRDELRLRWPALVTPAGDVPHAVLATPVPAPEGHPVGAIVLTLGPDQRADARVEQVVVLHAHEAGRALTRTRRQQREHDVAVELQRSLLVDELPSVEGLAFAARYQAGATGLEVGGDWYDAVRRPDGIVHVTVGDVAGRGTAAAAMMGQLRNAFRAYAFEHASPAEIVSRLARHVPDDGMATVVCVAIDPIAGEMRYVSAGHPPLLLLDGGTGDVEALDVVSAPPLGWSTGAVADELHTLEPGSVLLAYTDGLIERRGVPLDDGIEAVVEALRDAGEAGVGEIVEQVLSRAMAGSTHDDDLAVLVARFAGAPASVRFQVPGLPSLVAEIRRRTGAWLAARGLPEAQRTDAVLAVSEACNNAIEHGYGTRPGVIDISLDHHDDRVRITIADHGTWRAPSSEDSTRGRGIRIMRATMDAAEIEHDDDGTRVALELRVGP